MLRGRRVAVLGAAGFIGRNLCEGLQRRGAAIRVFGRRVAQLDAAWERVEAEWPDQQALARAVADCGVVFHLIHATTPLSSTFDVRADIETSVSGTIDLLEICRAMPEPPRIVFVSSGGAIYGSTATLPISEDATCEPITPYGVNKLAIEKYLAVYRHLYGVDYRILRVSNPYGRYQAGGRQQGVVSAVLARALDGRTVDVWGDGTVTRDYIQIDDVVSALLAAAEHEGEDRLFNIGSGVGTDLNGIIQAIEAVLHLRVEHRFTEGRRVDVPSNVLDITRARQCLGWKPSVTLQEGIAMTAAWMRLQG